MQLGWEVCEGKGVSHMKATCLLPESSRTQEKHIQVLLLELSYFYTEMVHSPILCFYMVFIFFWYEGQRFYSVGDLIIKI